MAKKEADAKKDNLETDEKKPAKKKPILVIAIVGILVLMNGIGAAIFLMKGNKNEKDSEESHVEETKKSKAIYFSLDPAFLVNFKDESNKSHLLQVKMSVMHRDHRIDELLKANAPLIRNNLLVLLSSQNFGKIQTQEGKSELAEAALDEVQSILQDEEGDDTIVIERILFNDFVIQ